MCLAMHYQHVNGKKVTTNFWDLAGSEKFTTEDQLRNSTDFMNVLSNKPNFGNGSMKREYSSINRSLATLNRLVTMLTDEKDEKTRKGIIAGQKNAKDLKE